MPGASTSSASASSTLGSGSSRAPTFDSLTGPRADLAREIPRRPRVKSWMVLLFALVFAALVTPAITADRIAAALGLANLELGQPAKVTVRLPPLAGAQVGEERIDGGYVIARGETAKQPDVDHAATLAAATPRGAGPYFAFFALAAVFAGLFSHHMRRSNFGRLTRVQLVSLALVVALAIAVAALMLLTSLSVLVVPVAIFAILPTLALDRVVGLATGTLAALVVSLLVPFDVNVAILLLVQAGTAGLVVGERPKHRLRAALAGGGMATLLTALTYPLLVYFTTGKLPFAELSDPLRSSWIATTIGPALATVLAMPLLSVYQLLVGEITHGQLVALEDLSNPLLRQIADRAPGTWQHSLMMANMAELAANAIGADGRLVRVGAYYHDLGKSLSPKHFIENLEPGETSPHDQLQPEASCDAIFMHVTEGIVAAKRAGLHPRVIDFMHMHHGNGVLEYFWAKCQEQGNPSALTVEHFRYPGVPPQTRETAILAICDAVEAASRTLKKPDPAAAPEALRSAIDRLVQRIVYGKLHLGQLDDSGLAMGDLRRVADSLRETIRHANHGRIEYPWQKAQEDASSPAGDAPPRSIVQTGPRLDALDVPPRAQTASAPLARAKRESDRPETAPLQISGAATPRMRVGKLSKGETGIEETAPVTPLAKEVVTPAAAAPLPLAAPEVSGTSIGRPLGATHMDGNIGRADGPHFGSAPHVARGTPEMPTLTNLRKAGSTGSPEAAKFANDARAVLDRAGNEIAGGPRAKRESVAPDQAMRKRAATIPPTPTQLLTRRPSTMSPDPKATLPGPMAGSMGKAIVAGIRPPAPSQPVAAKFAATVSGLPATPPGGKPAAEIVEEETEADDDRDSSVTSPRLMRVDSDDITTDPEAAALEPPPQVNKKTSWRNGLASRVEAALDADFGGDTPTRAPTRAELQAAANAVPDATRLQSIEEIETLKRAATERSSDSELKLTRRSPATSEIEEDDIEAAIELAPAARKSAIGIAKKKPKE